MMDYNPNWERWCKISIAKHFEYWAEENDVFFFIEGFERDTEGKLEHFELRMDGPNIRETAKGQWRLMFEINMLISCQEKSKNSWRPQELTGIVSSIFMNNILVKKYGTGPDDDQAHLGCLSLIMPRAGGERVQTSHFGKINPTSGIIQATVEGHYDIHLD